MLNWRTAPDLLTPLVPAATTLDTWEGAHYVSLVGFLFVRTRVLGFLSTTLRYSVPPRFYA